jgi:hypothetical protein
VPRFEELINASKTCKTPSCSIQWSNTSRTSIQEAVDCAFKLKELTTRMLVSECSIQQTNLANIHPEYFLLPDIPWKKHKHNPWTIRVHIDRRKMANEQLETQDIVFLFSKCISKTYFLAYTDDYSKSNVVFDIGTYGKKNTEKHIKRLRQQFMKIILRGVKKIKKAFVQLENDCLSIETEGTNLSGIHNITCEYENIKTITSNDTFDVLKTYGI